MASSADEGIAGAHPSEVLAEQFGTPPTRSMSHSASRRTSLGKLTALALPCHRLFPSDLLYD